MIPTDDLLARAERLALAVADEALGGPVYVTTEGHRVEWDGFRKRHVHEQELSVWKPFALLDLILDEQQRVVGYVDHEAYQRGDEAATLSEDEIRGIVADDEVLPAFAQVVSHARIGALVHVEVVHGERRYRVEINPARRLLAAVRPL